MVKFGRDQYWAHVDILWKPLHIPVARQNYVHSLSPSNSDTSWCFFGQIILCDPYDVVELPIVNNWGLHRINEYYIWYKNLFQKLCVKHCLMIVVEIIAVAKLQPVVCPC